MRFYFQNNMGDSGYFSEDNLIKAIYAAWNIEAELWLLNKGVKKLDFYNGNWINQARGVFAPMEENGFNSDALKEFGYYMVDGKEAREIRRISDDVEVRYDWSEVKQLI